MIKLLASLLVLFSPGVKANTQITLNTVNTVVLRGVVDDKLILDTQLKLTKLVALRGAKKYPIYLVLDTPGGSVESGLDFIAYAKTVPNLHTVTIFAASMGSAIVEALPGERLLTPIGTLMFHRAAGEFKGYFETGEVESELHYGKVMVRHMEITNSSRMKMRLEDYKHIIQNELWLFGEIAVYYRAADRVVDITCTQSLINSKESTSVSGLMSLFLGDATMSFSGCPLLRSPLTSDSKNKVTYVVPSVRTYKKIKIIGSR